MTQPTETRINLSSLTTDPGQSLELLRRIRSFAAELRDAGIGVEISGWIDVKIVASPPAEPIDDAELPAAFRDPAHA